MYIYVHSGQRFHARISCSRLTMYHYSQVVLQLLIVFLWHYPSSTHAQSNYADHANNVEYLGEGLPEQATLDGKVTKLDDLSPVIFLNRTKAALNCASGSMQVELKFNEQFFGIAYADFDRNSACQLHGNGGYSYKLELPLKGCGTKQDPQRVFTNNIVVRFHSSLEIDGDEIITIVCRYPPPVAPIPAAPPSFIREDLVPATIIEPPLKGFQILMIICGILFLTLLLLGLGGSYYCLRRRNVAVVRKQQFSSVGSASEITKLSGSSLGNLSMFEGLKIPRVHATQVIVASSSGSEGPLISDTLPSDYPSESHSDADDVDNRSIPVSSAGSFDNKGYVQETSIYSSEYRQEEVSPPPQLPRIDVQQRSSQLEHLSTIQEQREDSVKSMEAHQFQYTPELHLAPCRTYNAQRMMELSETVEEPPIAPVISSHLVDDVYLRTITEKQTIEDIEKHKRLITEYHQRARAQLPQWDVTIRNYPVEMPDPPEWENFSDVSSMSSVTAVGPPRKLIQLPVQSTIRDNKLPLNSPELVYNVVDGSRDATTTTADYQLSTFDVPLENPHVANWNVLIRVLQQQQVDDNEDELTLADRMRWRQIITTESTLRQMLSEANSREDFERIRHDSRYERMFTAAKWDVIIRTLTSTTVITRNTVDPRKSRHRKKSDWDARSSRRSSLPTVYEYDSDGSLRVTHEVVVPPVVPTRSRRTSRASYRSDAADVRSMSEMTVDFGRAMIEDVEDVGSGGSGTYLARTLSQPSLVRSASEYTERNWAMAAPTSEFTGTPEPSPKLTMMRRTTLAPDSTGRSWSASEEEIGSSATRFARYAHHQLPRSSKEMKSSSTRRNWFADNDSEASYK